MKKYLLVIFGLLFMSLSVPIAADAKPTADAKVDLFYYEPPTYDEKLSPADMAGAQEISVGSTARLDFRVEDYKVFKLTLAANQLVRIKEAGDGDIQGYVNKRLFNEAGEWEGSYYEDMLGSDQPEVWYILMYSNAPSISHFTVESLLFTDNINQKSTEGTEFGFVPSVTGIYEFTLYNKYDKEVYIALYDFNPDVAKDMDDEWSEGEYTAVIKRTLTAGKLYGIDVGTNGKYTLSMTKSPAADAVSAQIARIGTVTASSGAAIDGARAAFNALLPAEQKLVNEGALAAAEKQYADLTKPYVGRVKIKKAVPAKSAKARKATISWKKVSGADGYQIVYSYKKKFKKAKAVKVSSRKTKTVLKKLSRKKRYSVKVRAFKNYRGQTYYGKYSTVKKFVMK